MKRLLFIAALSSSPALAQQTATDLLVPRLMLFQIDSDQPQLRAIGTLPATITEAPILIFDDDGSISISSMEVDDQPPTQDDNSSPDSP